MKKFLVFGLALLLLSSALFADDAKVMPLRTGRLSLAPSFTMGEKKFDDEGSRVDAQYDSLKMLNFGAALEYGIISWITGAIQWAPGVNMWSKLDMSLPLANMSLSTSDVRLLDVGDLFVGAKMQILGKDAPVKNEMIRLAFAPGIKIPFSGPDFDKQAENAVKGDKVTPDTLDNHALAAGLRSYFDFIINDKFFINFYNEALFYATKRDLGKTGYQQNLVASGIDQINQLAGALMPTAPALFEYGKTKYGYELTFELEPTFSTPLGPILFTASLPITYKTTPGKKYDVGYNKALVDGAIAAIGSGAYDAELAAMLLNQTAAIGMLNGLAAQVDSINASEGQTHALSINPGIAVMFYKWKVPFEFEFNYKAPIWGMRGGANHTFVFIAKMFFKI